jgi:hypothetical protein
MIVKPVPDRLVRDPETMRPLPAEGLRVDDDNLHWIRLREDGDVTIEPDPAPPATPAPEESGS